MTSSQAVAVLALVFDAASASVTATSRVYTELQLAVKGDGRALSTASLLSPLHAHVVSWIAARLNVALEVGCAVRPREQGCFIASQHTLNQLTVVHYSYSIRELQIALPSFCSWLACCLAVCTSRTCGTSGRARAFPLTRHTPSRTWLTASPPPRGLTWTAKYAPPCSCHACALLAPFACSHVLLLHHTR